MPSALMQSGRYGIRLHQSFRWLVGLKFDENRFLKNKNRLFLSDKMIFLLSDKSSYKSKT